MRPRSGVRVRVRVRYALSRLDLRCAGVREYVLFLARVGWPVACLMCMIHLVSVGVSARLLWHA